MNITTQQKQVLDTIETMTTSFHSSNISGIMSTYASDATVVFEPGKLVSGKSDIQSAFEQMFPLSPKFSFGKHDVFITGNIATHIVPWDMTATLPDGSTMNESGLSVSVLKKQTDGKWLMILDNPHAGISLDSM